MDTLDFFIGARLAAAREKAGISLEKAAKDTRIRVARLREIESDDFSGFAHPTYARLFLLDYAEYLGVPQAEIRPILPDRMGPAGGGFQYIDALAADLPSKGVSPRTKRRRIAILFLALAGLLVLTAVVLYTYVTLQKIERVAASKSLGDLADETAGPPPVPAPPAAEPSPATGEENVMMELVTQPVDAPATEAFTETTLDLIVPVPPPPAEGLPSLEQDPAPSASPSSSESPTP